MPADLILGLTNTDSYPSLSLFYDIPRAWILVLWFGLLKYILSRDRCWFSLENNNKCTTFIFPPLQLWQSSQLGPPTCPRSLHLQSTSISSTNKIRTYCSRANPLSTKHTQSALSRLLFFGSNYIMIVLSASLIILKTPRTSYVLGQGCECSLFSTPISIGRLDSSANGGASNWHWLKSAFLVEWQTHTLGTIAV